MKSIKLGVIMDPIASIHFEKDSTLAMLWEAERRHWAIDYFEIGDLFLHNGVAYGYAKSLKVFQDSKHWFELGPEKIIPLADLNVILMRKDPPFNLDYIYATQILDHAEKEGVLVVNKPQALRNANEKLFAAWFPQCCPETRVTKRIADLKQFLKEQVEIVCKPLHAMGGQSIFYLKYPDVNSTAVFETLTNSGTQFVMAQRFIPDIKEGDKRILLVEGEPIPYALARIPAEGEFRGNLAAGAKGVAQPLTERDRWICQQVCSTLHEQGLYFVGLDVIGDYLTEVNVTSPTCIRELDAQCGLNISAILLDSIEKRLLLS
jgi:glutathione synthase